MYVGQRQEEHPGGADDQEHHHGLHADGHHLHPPQLRAGGGHQQHLHREEAPVRLGLRGARGVHGRPQVRHAPPRLPLRLPLLLPLHPLRQPGQLPHQRPLRRRHGEVRVRCAGEGVRAEHGGEPAVLRGAADGAVDIRAGAGGVLVGDDGADAVQP
ncbi:hypothetical protein Cni_G17292 [Canna indica]|uniref:Uncharacterized protein n=1 Tax=Canna indica TaxID=4628 RepID=A0AAQ3KHG5_9LILI|nr:hypothetical protein Cni_G17292 [Canna indica]